jgi:NAD(P)-dependent dehydrogenase (short-subunit alcohol dehydrogenase family)
VAERPLWSLEGRVALVTGAGRGMGRTHCLELARRGARISALDLDGDVAAAVAAEVSAAGGSALSFAVDVCTTAGRPLARKQTVRSPSQPLRVLTYMSLATVSSAAEPWT